MGNKISSSQTMFFFAQVDTQAMLIKYLVSQIILCAHDTSFADVLCCYSYSELTPCVKNRMGSTSVYTDMQRNHSIVYVLPKQSKTVQPLTAAFI